ncbi:MAG: protein kinase domain-containing protein [Clostridium chrysemydis]|uniref:protein kinase domain-containing protein n=1 Tax=Clostridium chrysemydis TaxID=2665504 RepID=UPI003F3EFC86
MDKYFFKGQMIEDYKLVKLLGQGRYGIAYLGIDNYGKKVVVKQFKKEMLKISLRNLKYEIEILEKLNYKNFPKFVGTFKDKYREGYILEYIEGKVFDDLVYKENLEFNRRDIFKVCYKLLDIIEVLQRNNIAHRDIRLPNVIVKEDNSLGLIDFGLAKFIDNRSDLRVSDFWYLGDFLIHLYYTKYNISSYIDRPWYEELKISKEEKYFLKRLMSKRDSFKDTNEIRRVLDFLISSINNGKFYE